MAVTVVRLGRSYPRGVLSLTEMMGPEAVDAVVAEANGIYEQGGPDLRRRITSACAQPFSPASASLRAAEP